MLTYSATLETENVKILSITAGRPAIQSIN